MAMRRRAARATRAPGEGRKATSGGTPTAAHPEPGPEGGTQRGLNWIGSHSEELYPRYAGQWIAVDDEKLVAVAPDLPAVMRLAAERGHRLPLVMQVPIEPLANLAFSVR
jgi:uncharacterized protein DUF5678